jgi:uncharacterized membrane protein YheB (UPF0754 family)
MIPWYGLLIVFPLVCALIGWITNKLAVKMIFYPIEPLTVVGLRFQGVLPKHHRHFAREMGLVVTTDFMTTGEMVDRVDADRVIEAVRPAIEEAVAEVLADLRGRLSGPQQALLSDAVLSSARKQLERELERELPGFKEQVRDRADELVDLTDTVTEKLVQVGREKLVEIISFLGRKELKFIEYYGGIFGFLIGLVQFAVIFLFPIRYAIVVVGALVGAVTNYLAIKMLFYPRLPRRVLLFKVQGLFPKRQGEIASEIARIAAEEFIVSEEIFEELARRALPPVSDPEQLDRAEAALADRFPALKAMLDAMLGPEQQQAFRHSLQAQLERRLPQLTRLVADAAARQLDMNAILENKVSSLPKLKFEDIIRGLFAQEELYLVIYGALLGGMMGALQLGLMLIKQWV